MSSSNVGLRARRLASLTYPEVDCYLRDSTEIVLPVGSTEQHGHSGILSIDTVCAKAVSDAISVRTGILVAPAISFGMAQHHLAFAGTISLRPTTIISIVEDIVASLAASGFTRFIIINGHGGNIASYRAAIDLIQGEMSLTRSRMDENVKVTVNSWWDPKEVSEYCRENFGQDDGEHVTPSEVSIAMHSGFGQRVFDEAEVAPIGSFTHSRDFQRKFPDGRVGSKPSLANRLHGAALVEIAAVGLIKLLDLKGLAD